MSNLKQVSLAVAVALLLGSTSVMAQGRPGSGWVPPPFQGGGNGGGEVQPMPVPPPFQGGDTTAVGVGVGIGQGGAGGAGGAGGSVGDIRNDNRSSASSTNFNTNTNTNANTAFGGNAAAGAVSGSVSGAVSEGSSASSNFSVGDINVQVGNPNEDRSLTRSFDTIDQNINYSGRYDVRNVPDAYAPNLGATSPCMGSTSLGGSGVGFGFSAGTTWHDKDCTIRETARSFAGMGMTADATAILCSSEYAAAAPSCVAFREDQAAGYVASFGPTGERPTTGFRYAPQTGERICAYDSILASRNKLPMCP
jgi:hypothetical protein